MSGVMIFKEFCPWLPSSESLSVVPGKGKFVNSNSVLSSLFSNLEYSPNSDIIGTCISVKFWSRYSLMV